jgi:hypothetical protein
MKRKITLFILLLATTLVVNAQDSKKRLLAEVDAYEKSVYLNKPYDVEFSDLFNALKAVGYTEYSELTKESEKRGYLEFYFSNESIKETLSIEILGDEKPYRLVFSVKQEANTNGQWQQVNKDFNPYFNKIRRKLYLSLFNKFDYPEDLLKRIEAYNLTQKKDKNKIY